jgi:hypothetical protein
MDAEITLVITAMIVAVAAATMAVKVQPVYAPGGVCSGCASPFAPGQLAISNVIPARTFAPGILAAETGQPASQFAPGQAKNLNSPG